MTIEERLQQSKEFLDNAPEGQSLETALEFLRRFKTVYTDVKKEYTDEYKVYHLAEMLLYTALCLISIEYGIMGESEIYHEISQFEAWGAGIIPSRMTGEWTSNI